MLADDLRFGVDLQAAHRVVDAGLDFDGVELRRANRAGQVGTAEFGVFLGFEGLVVSVKALRQRVGRGAHGLGEFRQRGAFLDEAQFEVAVDLLQALVDHRVEDQESRSARLRQHGL